MHSCSLSFAIAKNCASRETALRADTFHKPGFKMHVKILHHLFGVVGGDVIKAPLWDVAALGPAAYPSNAVFVHHHVTQLLTTSFPNMRAQQVEVRPPPIRTLFSWVSGRAGAGRQPQQRGGCAAPRHPAAHHPPSPNMRVQQAEVRRPCSAPCFS